MGLQVVFVGVSSYHIHMTTTITTTGLRAYNDSIRLAMPELVAELRGALGAKLVAYIAGVTETRTVREWAEGARVPQASAEERLRLTHRINALIGQSEGEAVVPTWLQGMNPLLGDAAPARVLREGPFDEAGPAVLAAANAFVGA